MKKLLVLLILLFCLSAAAGCGQSSVKTESDVSVSEKTEAGEKLSQKNDSALSDPEKSAGDDDPERRAYADGVCDESAAGEDSSNPGDVPENDDPQSSESREDDLYEDQGSEGASAEKNSDGLSPSSDEKIDDKKDADTAGSSEGDLPSKEEPAQSAPDPEKDTKKQEPVQNPVEEKTYSQADASGASESQISNEAGAMSQAEAAVPTDVAPSADGKEVKANGGTVIDYSNASDGYVMVCCDIDTNKRLKVKIEGPRTNYTYNIKKGEYSTFSLSDGNGSYKITVFQNVEGSKYAALVSETVDVTLKDEFAPFLHSNQYVNYAAAPKTVAKAREIAGGVSDPLQKVAAVYDFVVKGFTYDNDLAASVSSGYLPVLDSVLAKQKGICFDYAAVMTGMLRSQGVPCKLVVGYAGDLYHAWISVWSSSNGWIDGVIFFNGSTWQRMDPTFASSGGAGEEIMKYIGDNANYTAKYFY